MKILIPCFILALVIALASAPSAQEVAVSGFAVYVPDGAAEATVLPDGRSFSNSSARSVLIEDDPQSPIHLVSQDCAETDAIAADGSSVQSGGSCAAIDADGDVFRINYLTTPAGSRWNLFGGTGKFSAAEGGGTSEVVAVGPDSRVTIRYEGRFVMR